MFVTLQAGDRSMAPVKVTPSHLACVRCRTKKLKCTGEKKGCQKCRSKGAKCEYLEPPSRKGTRDSTKSDGSNGSSRRVSLSQNSSVRGSRANSSASLVDLGSAAARSPKRARIPATAASDPQLPPSPVSAAPDMAISDVSYKTPNNMFGSDDLPAFIDQDVDIFSMMDQDFDAGLWTFEPASTQPFNNDFAPFSPRSNYNSSVGSIVTDSETDSAIQPYISGMSLSYGTNRIFSDVNSSDTSQSTSPRTQQQPTNIDPNARIGAEAGTGTGECGCRTAALKVLEELSIQSVSANRRSMSRTLQVNKCAVLRCRQLMGCERCISDSSFVMLVIVLCQNLVGSYETLLGLLAQQRREGGEAGRSTPAGAGTGQDRKTVGRERMTAEQERKDEGWMASTLHSPMQGVQIEGYDIDLEEQVLVFEGIIHKQLLTLREILLHNERVSLDWVWDSHLKILQGTRRRFDELLKQCCAAGSTLADAAGPLNINTR